MACPCDHSRSDLLQVNLPVSVELALHQAAASDNDRDDDTTATILSLSIDVPLPASFRRAENLSHRVARGIVRILRVSGHEVTSDSRRVERWGADPGFGEWRRNVIKRAVREIHPILELGASREDSVIEGDPGVIPTALALDYDLNGSWRVIEGCPAEPGEHITLAESAATGVCV
jgi:hypothetical protein